MCVSVYFLIHIFFNPSHGASVVKSCTYGPISLAPPFVDTSYYSRVISAEERNKTLRNSMLGTCLSIRNLVQDRH